MENEADLVNMPLDDMHKPPEKFDDKNMNGNKMILPPP